MTKAGKIWLIAGIALIVIGCIIFGGVMMALKFDFKKLSTSKYETNEYVIADSYTDISIDTDTADILFVPYKGSETRVVCYEDIRSKHTVKAENGTLIITNVNNMKWYDRIGINFDTPKITVNIPAGGYGDIKVDVTTGDMELPTGLNFNNIQLTVTTGDITNRALATGAIKIKTTTGDICVENVSAGSLDLSATTGKGKVTGSSVVGDIDVKISTGKMNITDVTCTNLTAKGTTGDLSLKNVILKGKFNIKRSTGDVRLYGCDAAELYINTTTGDVKGTLLSGKTFTANTTTGDIDIPDNTDSGACNIKTTTGDIKIEIEPSA